MSRVASPLTKKIRELVRKDKSLTFSQAKPLLKDAGFPKVKSTKFNMVKYFLLRKKRKQKEAAPAQAEPTKAAKLPPPKHRPLDMNEALKFVTGQGGLAKAKEALAARRKTVNDQLAKLEADSKLVEAFEALHSQVVAVAS